jgi:DNA-binding winged helix-turn-helix (wHTH) protein/tetratricopeptide (TPR) repeat protein
LRELGVPRRHPPSSSSGKSLGGSVVWAFGDFELDEARFELRRDGALRNVQPKVLELLRYLVRNRGRVVTKDELLEHVWHEAHVGEASLSHAIMEARKALGEDSTTQSTIVTVRGRGYRFDAEVEARPARGSSPPLETERRTNAGVLRGQAFVGRRRELAELDLALEEVHAGRGRVVFLIGEPGIGKTRLAAELGTRAASRGMRVLWGRCWERGGGPPLWPWPSIVSAIRTRKISGLVRRADVGLDDIESFAPELVDSETPMNIEGASQSPQSRFRVFRAAWRLIEAATHDTPLVLLLDDLHEAQEPALLLLRFIASELRDARMLLLGTYREEALAGLGPARDLLAALGHESHPVRLVGLTVDEVTKLMQGIAGQQLPGELARFVHTTTAGNPLFVDEMVRVLIAEQRLDLDSAKSARIPLGVQEAIQRRLKPLGEAAGDVLSIAAAVGRKFDLPLVARVAGSSARQILDALSPAISSGIVEESGEPGSYCFSHALLREVLYEELTTSARTALHARVGEALENLGRFHAQGALATLANHFFAAIPQAGAAPKAMGYAMQAGDAARAVTAYEEARTLYKRALGLLKHLPELEARRAEIMTGIGHAERLTGDRTSAIATFEGAIGLARARDSGHDLIAATLGYADAQREFIGVDPNLISCLEEALAMIGSEDTVARVGLSSALAYALTFTPALERRTSLAHEAVSMARRVGDSGSLLRALEAERWVKWGTAEPPRRLAITMEAQRVAEERNDQEFVLETLYWEVCDRLETGDVAGVYRAMGRYANLGDKIAHPLASWRAAVWDAMRAMLEGRPDAEERVYHAYSIGQRVEHDNITWLFIGQKVTLLRDLGRLNEVRTELTAIVRKIPNLVIFRATLAHAHAEVGDVVSARAELEVLAADDFALIAHDVNRQLALAYVAEVCAVLGDRPRAARLYDLLLPSAVFNTVGGGAAALVSVTPLTLGRLAVLIGRPAEARMHFEAALARSLAMGAPPWTARAQLALAELLRQNAWSRDEAVALLEDAEATAKTLNLAPLLREAGEVRARLER